MVEKNSEKKLNNVVFNVTRLLLPRVNIVMHLLKTSAFILSLVSNHQLFVVVNNILQVHDSPTLSHLHGLCLLHFVSLFLKLSPRREESERGKKDTKNGYHSHLWHVVIVPGQQAYYMYTVYCISRSSKSSAVWALFMFTGKNI